MFLTILLLRLFVSYTIVSLVFSYNWLISLSNLRYDSEWLDFIYYVIFFISKIIDLNCLIYSSLSSFFVEFLMFLDRISLLSYIPFLRTSKYWFVYYSSLLTLNVSSLVFLNTTVYTNYFSYLSRA